MEFVEAARKDGFDIRLECQPPNIPDMNVLDLGFFRAIQSLQHEEAPTTIDGLIEAVQNSFDRLSVRTLNYVFLSLQQCMIEVMKVFGGNDYKLPHMGKKALKNIGNLHIRLDCESEIVEEAKRHLQLE